MRASSSRDAAIERICREYQARWESMTLNERGQALDRICSGGGVTRGEAIQRVSNPPCTSCGSTDLERGDVNICNLCGRIQ
jgi:hypothetical protein